MVYQKDDAVMDQEARGGSEGVKGYTRRMMQSWIRRLEWDLRGSNGIPEG